MRRHHKRSIVLASGHALGWRPDLPDVRDKVVAPPSSETLRRIQATPSVDLSGSASMPPVWNQGQLGSCTAHSCGVAYQFAALASGAKVGTPSRLFIYYGERSIEGTISQDSGAEIRDGFKVLSGGVPPETDWPYDITKFADAPPEQADTDATQHLTTIYQSVQQTIESVKAALVGEADGQGRPVSFGFTVYDSFESAQVAQSGIVPMPLSSESVLGGHAVAIVGYDDESQFFKVRNSWGSKDTDGTEWGVDGSGYFLMPYKYALDPDLADDFWVAEVAA